MWFWPQILNDTSDMMPLTVHYRPTSVHGKLRLWPSMDQTMRNLTDLGKLGNTARLLTQTGRSGGQKNLKSGNKLNPPNAPDNHYMYVLHAFD